MTSLHTETSRFKWVGHKNELFFLRNTLVVTGRPSRSFLGPRFPPKQILLHFTYITHLFTSQSDPTQCDQNDSIISHGFGARTISRKTSSYFIKYIFSRRSTYLRVLVQRALDMWTTGKAALREGIT